MTPGGVKELLVRACESSTSVVKNVRLTFEMLETNDSQWMEKNFPGEGEVDWKEAVLIRWEYTRNGEKERLDLLSYQSFPKADQAVSLPQANHPAPFPLGGLDVWIYDGQRELVYYPTKGTGDTQTQIGRAYRLATKRGLMAEGLAPVKLIAYEADCSPTSVLNSPDARIETKTEKMGGLRQRYQIT